MQVRFCEERSQITATLTSPGGEMGPGRRRREGQSEPELGVRRCQKSAPQQQRGSTTNANATAPDGFRLITRMESSAHFPLTHPPVESPEESNQHDPLAAVN